MQCTSCKPESGLELHFVKKKKSNELKQKLPDYPSFTYFPDTEKF